MNKDNLQEVAIRPLVARGLESYIIGGIRTPIGNYQGALASVRADDLGALVIKTVVANNPNIPASAYDDAP